MVVQRAFGVPLAVLRSLIGAPINSGSANITYVDAYGNNLLGLPQAKGGWYGTTSQKHHQGSHPQPYARGNSNESHERQRRLQEPLPEAVPGTRSSGDDPR